MNTDQLQQHLRSSITAKAWNRIGIYPHHGIDLSLASIRSQGSCGIGDFYDLIPIITWCKEVGFDVIQLLPLNDSGSDPSPYNAISSCALHPIYLSLLHLPFVKEDKALQNSITQMQILNSAKHVPYADILSQKLAFLRLYYEKYSTHWLHSEEYKTFIHKWDWVQPYALFKALKQDLGPQDFLHWPAEIKRPSEKTYKELIYHYATDIAFYSLLQYLCLLQFTHISSCANKNEILIKGDIPILISADSADVWHYPDLFTLDLRAGAPPDQYNQEGQYWGFPLFNWKMMEKHHFHWWQQRLEYASYCYHLFRVDHVIGFFRIWAITKDGDPKTGLYIPSNASIWEEQGRRNLEKIVSFTHMLPIAEDLGTVPPMAPAVLQEMGICGTKVMRWERYWNTDSRYIPPAEYPPLSMTTISTHDSPTLAQWWRDFPEEAIPLCARYGWDYVPVLSPMQRKQILTDSHQTKSLFHINLLQEYLNLYPELSWGDPDQERINIPGTVVDTNWTYKIQPSIETILAHKDLKKTICTMLCPRSTTGCAHQPE